MHSSSGRLQDSNDFLQLVLTNVKLALEALSVTFGTYIGAEPYYYLELPTNSLSIRFNIR